MVKGSGLVELGLAVAFRFRVGEPPPDYEILIPDAGTGYTYTAFC